MSHKDGAVKELELAARHTVAWCELHIHRCCGEQVGERFCESYGCTTLLELLSPLRTALYHLDKVEAPDERP